MGNKTGIEWTDATWNPIRGCSRVSEGCRHCYAERTAAFRLSVGGGPYEGLAIVKNGEPHWTGNIMFVEKRLLDPLRWAKPRRIFVNSMSDLFHENVTDEMRDRIFAVMLAAPQHTFQVLTKRPARMLEYFSENNSRYTARRIADAACAMGVRDHCFDCDIYFPLMNVRLGVSVENQKAADDRLDYLCELAAGRWWTMVSFEPLLSAVDPGPWWLSFGKKTWAIVGGESGPGARPMEEVWARSLRDQCVAAGVPFFFKQWGEYLPAMCDGPEIDGEITLNCSDEPMRVGKKAAGALLDGKEWKQFPEGRG